MLHYAYMCDVHIRDDIMRRKQQSVSNGEGPRFLVDNPHKNKDGEKMSGDGWFGTMWCSCDIIVMLELWFQPNKNSNSWWPVTIIAPLNRQSLYCYVVGFVIVAPQWHGPLLFHDMRSNPRETPSNANRQKLLQNVMSLSIYFLKLLVKLTCSNTQYIDKIYKHNLCVYFFGICGITKWR